VPSCTGKHNRNVPTKPATAERCWKFRRCSRRHYTATHDRPDFSHSQRTPQSTVVMKKGHGRPSPASSNSKSQIHNLKYIWGFPSLRSGRAGFGVANRSVQGAREDSRAPCTALRAPSTSLSFPIASSSRSSSPFPPTPELNLPIGSNSEPLSSPTGHYLTHNRFLDARIPLLLILSPRLLTNNGLLHPRKASLGVPHPSLGALPPPLGLYSTES